MDDKKLAELLEKYLDGELSGIEKENLEKESFLKLFDELKGFSDKQKPQRLLSEEVLQEKMKDLISRKVEKEQRKKIKNVILSPRFLGVFFTVSLVFFLGVFFLKGNFSGKRTAQNVLSKYEVKAFGDYSTNEGISISSGFLIVSKEDFDIKKDQIEIVPKVDFEIEKKSGKESLVKLKETLPAEAIVSVKIKNDDGFDQFSFKTVPAFKVLDTTPQDLKTAPVDTAIEIEFNLESFLLEDLESKVSIIPKIDGVWEKRGSKAVFIPKTELKNGQLYLVKIGSGIRESGGQILSEGKSFSFTASNLVSSESEIRAPQIGFFSDFLNVTQYRKDPRISLYLSNLKNALDVRIKFFKEDTVENILGYFVYPDENGDLIPKEIPDFDKMEVYQEIVLKSQDLSLSCYGGYCGASAYSPYPKENGIYYVYAEFNVDSEVFSDWAIVSVSDFGGNVLNDGEDFYLNLYDYKNDKFVDNAEVIGYSMEKEPKEVLRSSSLSNGEFKGNVGKIDYLLIKKDGQFVFLDIPMKKRPFYSKSENFYFYCWQEDFRPKIVFDRPIYRPGEEVNVSIFLFQEKNFTLEGYKDEEILANVKYYEENSWEPKVMTTFNLKKHYNGLYLGSFKVPPGAKTGHSFVEVEVKNKGICFSSNSFRIEEFQKPQSEIKISIPKETYVDGEKIEYEISGNYYFGAPISGGVGKVTVRGPYFSSERSKNFSFKQGKFNGSETVNYSNYANYSLSSSEAATYPLHASIEVEYTDDLGERIFAYKGFTILPSSLKIDYEEYKYETWKVGDEIKRNFVVKNTDGARIGGVEVSVKTSLVSWERVEVRREYNENTKKTYPVYEYRRIEEYLGEKKYISDEKGNFTHSFVPDKGGSYGLLLSVKDSKGREFRLSSSEYVESDKFSSNGQYEEEVEILGVGEKVKVGDEAKINILSRLENEREAFLVFHRGKIKESRKIEIKNGINEISYLTSEKDIPYMNLILIYFEDGEIKTIYSSIPVSSEEKELSIEIVSNEVYEPGSDINIKIITRNKKGAGVPSLGVLKVFDKSIESVAYDYDYSQKFINEMYINDYLIGVSNTNSVIWMELFDYQSKSFSSYYKNNSMGGGGGRGSDLESTITETRKDLKDLAFFRVFETREDGVGNVSFKLPDNLTEWKIEAFGFSEKNISFGNSSKTFKTSKKLNILTFAPKFLNKGDQVVIPVMIYNNTDSELKGEIKVSASGGDVINGDRQEFYLPVNKKSSVFNFKFFAKDTGNMKINVSAVSENGLSDSLEISIPVYPLGRPFADSENGKISSNSKVFQYKFNYQENLDPNATSLNMKISSSSRLLDLIDGLSYISSSYGFVQTNRDLVLETANMLDILENYDELENLGIKLFYSKDELKEKVSQNIKSLELKIRKNGAIGFYDYDSDDQFLSVFLTSVFSHAKHLMIDVREEVFSLSIKYSKSILNGKILKNEDPSPLYVSSPEAGISTPEASLKVETLSESTPEMKIFALYALSLTQKEKPVMEAKKLYEEFINGNIDDFSSSFAGFLSMALFNNGDTTLASNVLKKFEGKIITEKNFAYVEENKGPNKKISSSKEFESAIILKAISKVNPKSSYLEKISNWLLREKNHYGYWNSTLDTYFVTNALIVPVKLEKPSKNAEYEVYLNGKLISKEKLEDGKIRGENFVEVGLGGGDFQVGENILEVRHASGDPVYVDLKFKNFSTEWEKTDDKIEVTKKYLSQSGEEVNILEKGKTYTVLLTMTPKVDLESFILQDFLISAFNPVNPRLLSFSPEERYIKNYKRDYSWSGDFKKNFAKFFVRRFTKDEKIEIEYKVHVTHSGVFYQNGAFAESYNFPEVNGWIKGGKIEVKE